MTLDELKETQRLLEKAQKHAEQQADYLPDGENKVTWEVFDYDCTEILICIGEVIRITSEALHYEN